MNAGGKLLEHGLGRPLANTAQDLPFEDASVDEILCSYLLFVWIEDEEALADILDEFLRVLRPGAVAKLYPLHEWRFMRFRSKRLQDALGRFELRQHFVHGHGDWRVTPGMMTVLRKV